MTTSPRSDDSPPIILSTGLQAEPTHWKHTVLWLHPSYRLESHPGDEINGTVTYKRCESNDRDYEILLTWNMMRRDGSRTEIRSQKYKLGSS